MVERGRKPPGQDTPEKAGAPQHEFDKRNPTMDMDTAQRIVTLRTDLEMRRKMLERVKAGGAGMPTEALERDIQRIKDELRKLGVEENDEV